MKKTHLRLVWDRENQNKKNAMKAIGMLFQWLLNKFLKKKK